MRRQQIYGAVPNIIFVQLHQEYRSCPQYLNPVTFDFVPLKGKHELWVFESTVEENVSKTEEILEGWRKVQRFIICTPRPIIRTIKTWMVGGTYNTHGK
jgi:hypothetical protein